MTEAEKRALRDAFGAFATGVTIVTALEPGGAPRGFTANSFTSVSLDPPLVLICIANAAHSCATFRAASHFGVNILAEDQRDLSGLFASQEPDKFAQTSWRPGAEGVPLLPGSLCRMVCERHEEVEAGDHVVLIGRVVSFDVSEGPPLGYHRGNYFSIGLEDRLVNAIAGAGVIRIGAILEREGAILLREDADGRMTVPVAPGDAPTLPGLIAMLEEAGLSVTLDHLYSVYEDAGRNDHAIIYHGAASGEAPEGMRYVPLEEVPLPRVESMAERAMLERYRQEYRHGKFGIYQGDAERGVVHTIPKARRK
ncbi:flavin reductase family protein [Roseovarius spongiae]|nr:flavin reductase family protein [Roseovarius spongiae]